MIEVWVIMARRFKEKQNIKKNKNSFNIGRDKFLKYYNFDKMPAELSGVVNATLESLVNLALEEQYSKYDVVSCKPYMAHGEIHNTVLDIPKNHICMKCNNTKMGGWCGVCDPLDMLPWDKLSVHFHKVPVSYFSS